MFVHFGMNAICKFQVWKIWLAIRIRNQHITEVSRNLCLQCAFCLLFDNKIWLSNDLCFYSVGGRLGFSKNLHIKKKLNAEGKIAIVKSAHTAWSDSSISFQLLCLWYWTERTNKNNLYQYRESMKKSNKRLTLYLPDGFSYSNATFFLKLYTIKIKRTVRTCAEGKYYSIFNVPAGDARLRVVQTCQKYEIKRE